MTIKKQHLLTINETSQLLNVSKTSLRRWTNDGQLKCLRVGVRQERRFLYEDLHDFLKDKGQTITDVSQLEGIENADSGHICQHFRNAREQWHLYHPFLKSHLLAQAPVYYIYDEQSGTSLEDLLNRIRFEGEDPENLMRNGLFNPIPSSSAYLKTGVFSADMMIDFIQSIILNCQSEGFERILISGEMTWYLSNAPGVNEMIPYEERLNELLDNFPKVTILCHYDMNKLDGAITLGALCSHPVVQLPDRTVSGFYAA